MSVFTTTSISKGFGINAFAPESIAVCSKPRLADIIITGIFFVGSNSFNLLQISLPSSSESHISNKIASGTLLFSTHLKISEPRSNASTSKPSKSSNKPKDSSIAVSSSTIIIFFRIHLYFNLNFIIKWIYKKSSMF